MRRLVTILILLTVSAAAFWCYRLLVDDARPEPIGPGGSATTAEVAADPAGTRTVAAGDPERDPDLTAGAALTTPATVEIQVVALPAVSLPHVEFTATSPDGWHATGHTGADGSGHLVVPLVSQDGRARLDRREVRFAAAAGAPVEVTLAPGDRQLVTIRLQPRGFAAGRVVDPAGRGIAVAEVLFLAGHDHGPGEIAPHARALAIGRTNATGTFRVPLVGRGFLGARHGDHAPSRMLHTRTLPRDPTTAVARVVLELGADAAAVTGIVLATDGRPARNAELRLAPGLARSGSRLAAPPVVLRTDDRGCFAVTALPPGPVTYEARAADGSCARGTLALDPLGERTLRIVLTAPATVVGRLATTAGETVAGVVEFGTSGELLHQRTRCGPDGAFEVAALPAGAAHLIARDANVVDRSHAPRSVGATLELAADERVTWQPRLPARHAGAELRGVVFGRDQRPLPDWIVVARAHADQPAVQVRTDRDGRFAVPAEADSRFDVLVFAPDTPPNGFAATTRQDVGCLEGALLLQVDPDAATRTVCGSVRTQDGAGVTAAVACWHRERQQTIERSADETGRFRIDGVPSGTVILFVSHPGFVGATRELEITASAGSALEVGAIVLSQGAVVLGSVTRADGGEAPVLELAIETENGDARFEADYAAGGYRFDAIPAGRHRLLVHGDGIAASVHPIEVRAGVELHQDLVVERGIERIIEVTNPLTTNDEDWVSLALRPPGGAHIVLLGKLLPRGGCVRFTACMAAGSYELIAWDGDGRQFRSTVEFAAPGAQPVRVALAED